jgi:hypothetical protein
VSNLYVYRLEVELPEGSLARDWRPAAWEEICKKRGWSSVTRQIAVDDFESSFRWPRRRNYFSADQAQRQALLLRECGAKVAIRVGRAEWIGTWGRPA